MQNPGKTIISQYAQSPTLNLLIATLNTNIDPAANITAFYNSVWNIATATGYGLDVLGRIVGVVRVLTVTGYGQYALSDDAFRTLIYAKALSNLCDGSIPGINAILMLLFPNKGDCYVTDGADMTMTIHLGFTPNPVQATIIAQSGVIPKPVGVVITTPGGSVGTLAITIGAGSNISAATDSAAFASNTATATGGSGSYSFAWNETDDGDGTWAVNLTGGGRTAGLSVAGVANGDPSTASLTCTVTDTVAGGTATSGAASYTMTNTAVPPLSVTIGTGQGVSGVGGHTYGPNTATASGGSGSYTYDWEESDDSAGSWSIANSTTATATISVAGVVAGEVTTARMRCTITDTATGAMAASPTVAYIFRSL